MILLSVCVHAPLVISFILIWKFTTLMCVGYWAVWTNELKI